MTFGADSLTLGPGDAAALAAGKPSPFVNPPFTPPKFPAGPSGTSGAIMIGAGLLLYWSQRKSSGAFKYAGVGLAAYGAYTMRNAAGSGFFTG